MSHYAELYQTILAESRLARVWQGVCLTTSTKPLPWCHFYTDTLMPDERGATIHLPLPNDSMNLIVLPHFFGAGNPSANKANHSDLLAEVWRVLAPQGVVLISAMQSGQNTSRQAWHTALENQGFTMAAARFYGYGWRHNQGVWTRAWLEAAGDRWWPNLGAGFALLARKQMAGMHLIRAQWSKQARTQWLGAQTRTKFKPKETP